MTAMDRALATLREVFGYGSFRPGQGEAVEAILSGRDLMAVMPTGAGKSLCYQIPALLLDGVTVVVSPLISLMRDQVDALGQCGVRAAFLNTSLIPEQYSLAIRNAYRGMYRIVYVAPERLLTRGFINFAQRRKIAQVVIDEAHCVSQWGQDFRPAYLAVGPFLKQLPNRPRVSAFTATATQAVREDIERLLGLNDPVRVLTGFDRPNLRFLVRHPADRDDELLRFVKAREGQCGIVYCGTRKNVEQVEFLLRQNGVNAAGYHAGMDDDARKYAQDAFVDDRVDVIVATNAFGMGIDKSNVSFVVHYNMPKDLESYYQEAGRAGRDGEDAECLLLYDGRDMRLNNYLIARSHPEGLDKQALADVRARAKERLARMKDYATGDGCLRAAILRYFGEDAPDRCGNCSFCLAPAAPVAPVAPVAPAAAAEATAMANPAGSDAPDARGKSPARGRRRPSSPASASSSPAPGAMLYARLSLLRRRIADEQRVPPFIIFTNATLRDMARKRPKTPRAMLRVEGVGERKLERYGDAFLKEIARFLEENR